MTGSKPPRPIAMKPKAAKRWAMQWRSDNSLDGRRRHLIGEGKGLPMLFMTRAECRRQIEDDYGYIRVRADLRAEPHGWKMPVAVRVIIMVRPA